VVAVSGALGYLVSLQSTLPAARSFQVTARSFSFDPPVMRVNRGDHVTLRFASTDVVHGFYLEGYDLDVTIRPLRLDVDVERAGSRREAVREVTFTADRPGKYRYRCSTACGAMHPFMVGELLVEPNWLWPASAATAGGLLLAGGLLAWARSSGVDGDGHR